MTDETQQPSWLAKVEAARHLEALLGDTPFVSVMDDFRDGEALRLLREALPKDWTYGLDATPGAGYIIQLYDDTGVQVFVLPGRDGARWRHAEGATIAEAADECREALLEATQDHDRLSR